VVLTLKAMPVGMGREEEELAVL